MTEPTAQAVLSRKLCPWLIEPLERCCAAIAGERLGHAWLIHGLAGIGKTNLAFTLAQRLLMGTQAAAPEAISPRELASAMAARRDAQNHHPDLQYLFPDEDKATIGIEQIRTVIETLSLKSFAGAAKVVIIEPAEAMTVAAANGLLKTLEQPSPHSYLLLVSHCPGRLPATIRSRCQRLAIRAPTPSEVRDWADGSDTGARAHIDATALRTPLAAAAALSDNGPSADGTYAQELSDLNRGKADPIAIADAWAKRDLSHALDWLIDRLQASIRAKSLARGSTPITETGPDELHTAGQDGLSLRSCFEQLDQAEELRNQLGGGINTQLALRVLLLGFRPQRETT